MLDKYKALAALRICVGSDDKTVGKGPKNLADGLECHAIRYQYHETEGGHTWINWRHYLNDFAPQLLR